MLACPLAVLAADPAPPVVTLLEGTAILVRGVTRYALAEGVRLQSGDILETADKALAEMEFADGTALTLGPETRVLAAALPRAGAARGDFYFPQGVAKFGRVKADARLRVTTPFGTVQPATGAAVLRVTGSGLQVFAEGGPVAISGQPRRGAPAETLRLRTGEFSSGKSVQRGGVRPRPTPEFIAALPRLFLDPLPSRLARVKDRPAQPRQMAQQDVGKGVKGNATAVGIVSGNAAAVAAGLGADAENAVGAIGKDARVGGNATAVGIVSGNAAAVAAGLGADAENKVGTIAE